MLDLAALQTAMSQGLLTGRYDDLEDQVRMGPIGAAEALGLHRHTVLHGLTHALRLGFPTVDALVGERFFDQAARAYARDHPPAKACLIDYGHDFPGFLAAYALAGDLPYLPDVAWLDRVVETVAGASIGEDGVTLELGEATLTLDASLRVVRLAYPAAAIRDALDDDAALARLDLKPGRHAYALWRLPDGAAIRDLDPASGAFLEALLRGATGDAALAAALAERDDLSVLQAEIFAAPFARLTLNPGTTS